MIAESSWSLRNIPRERLEAIALRAVIEARSLHQQGQPNRFFHAVLSGFALGAIFATAGFLVGAAIR